MSENTNTVPDTEDYRAELLSRAALLGISVHPMAKNETIAAKIKAKLEEGSESPETAAEPATEKVITTAAAAQQSPQKNPKEKVVHPAKRLHRVTVTCNDPQKADQSGDIISVSNGVVGDIRFYVHFNTPWHVPHIVLETMKESKMFLHSSRKDGTEVVTREVPRYNIQYLQPLSEKERERIAAKQAAALASED